MPREIALTLPAARPGETRTARLARALVADIRRGRLRPGQALPSSRALAKALGLQRNTVVQSLGELEAEGWLTTAPRRGVFVAHDLPPRAFAPRGAPPDRAGFPLGPAPAATGRTPYPAAAEDAPYPLLGGRPDLRLVPAAELARALRRALVGRKGPRLLGYGDPQGLPRLRRALSDLLADSRGVAVGPERLLVTAGSQMALALAAEVLVRPGDAVGVEALGYTPAWDALRRAGSALVPLPVDEQGLVVAALEARLPRRPLRAVYLTPHHQFPTTATLSAPRRLQLLELARRHRFALIEDDYDHEFHYDGRPVLPLAAGDEAGVVVYIGTLSKILAPALRVGWLAGPAAVVERAAALRRIVDRQGVQLVEEALAALIEDDVVGRHVRRARRLYRARRDALRGALERRLPHLIARPSTGGLALWAEARDPSLDVDAWVARAAAAGVVTQPASAFTFDRSRPAALRLGFAALDERRLDEAIRRLAACEGGAPRSK